MQRPGSQPSSNVVNAARSSVSQLLNDDHQDARGTAGGYGGTIQPVQSNATYPNASNAYGYFTQAGPLHSARAPTHAQAASPGIHNQVEGVGNASMMHSAHHYAPPRPRRPEMPRVSPSAMSPSQPVNAAELRQQLGQQLQAAHNSESVPPSMLPKLLVTQGLQRGRGRLRGIEFPRRRCRREPCQCCRSCS